MVKMIMQSKGWSEKDAKKHVKNMYKFAMETYGETE